jgi:integrase
MLLQADGTNTTKLQVSAINTVARALGCAPHDLPADPAELRQQLATISPAMAGLTTASWSSVRSRLLKALRRAEVRVMPARRTKPLSPEWEPLYRVLKETGPQAALARMIGYFSDRQVLPTEVCDGYVQRFAAELNATSIRGKPKRIIDIAIRSWNVAVDQIPGWPQRRLTEPERKREGYVFPASQFPTSFQRSLADYLAFLADPPDDDDAPLRGLRPSTLHHREFQFRQMASALVHTGVPIEEVTGVDVLVQRESVDRICAFFTERSGQPDQQQMIEFLRFLRPVALHHVKDRSLADWISRRVKRLTRGRRQVGMTEKNRRRIAIFRDPRHVRDLLLLPYKLMKRAESGTLPPNEAAKLVRAAVAVEIEIMCPIRLRNLSELNMDTDFVRSRAGKGGPVHLFIPGARTKNGEDIELEIPKDTMALIDLYMAKYRHLLIDPGSRGKGRYLFPKSDGMPKEGRVFADAICRVMERELGIRFNMHLFRHLGCYLFLRSHPGQLDVMRRVLGHRDATTTMRFYAHVEQSDAFRLFDSHVLRIREEAIRPSRNVSARKSWG